ncbi:MAG TPA: hypothetical protein VH394_19525 [Thermoanaerobaculia bacterium]|jgi:hypothetical protein|nr:hypothetical protein [Thermoanaerobaculia bacterium]
MRIPRLLLLIAISLIPVAAQAQTEPQELDLWFIGYETEPAMDFGGRTLASIQSGISRGIGSIKDIGERHPGVTPAWEFPVGAALLLVQHEVGGHGGRAREFGLGPSYGFGFDFSGYTNTDRAPRTNEELLLLAAGGVEADQILARRVFLDMLREEGTDAARIPLAFMAKLDLSLYVSTVPHPRPGDDEGDFSDEAANGNDMTLYLVGRQAQRRRAPAAAVWDGTYVIDFEDPLLEDNWDDARITAIWNVLDPTLAAGLFAYFRDHVLHGESRVHAPMLHAGNVNLILGTRGALGPQSVSRFLDLHAATRQGVFSVYIRDLDSSIDRAYGAGAGVHGLRLGSRVELGLSADIWSEPESVERLSESDGWNATAEVNALLGAHWGLSAKAGAKSEGFFPGLPQEDGPYVGLGVMGSW